jgi:phospholipid/cholesterol/gamma-HCH transport system permease protein
MLLSPVRGKARGDALRAAATSAQPERMRSEPHKAPSGAVTFDRTHESMLVVRLSGVWQARHGMPRIDNFAREIAAAPAPRQVRFETSDLGRWDSSLVALVAGATEACRAHGIEADLAGLPAGLRRLVELAEAVPEKEGARARPARPPLLERVGLSTYQFVDDASDFLSFLGAVAVALARFVTGRARDRPIDLMTAIQDCGASAFGIVTLISFLVGVILAFMGAIQLQQFGASIYVADLVGIGMVRDMGAMMTAIIMAGRTGASFAAQLGTMKVTQEIDALTTMGLSPIEFLVVPRVVALVLMMPLLCLFSDLMGIMGGAAVSAGMLGVSFTAYYRETIQAITIGGIWGGVTKSVAYGVIIAISGCLRGFQCGNSSSAVGDAATSAVVTGIVYIVVACGIFAVVYHILGI